MTNGMVELEAMDGDNGSLGEFENGSVIPVQFKKAKLFQEEYFDDTIPSERLDGRLTELEYRMMIQGVNTILKNARAGIRKYLIVAFILYFGVLFGSAFLLAKYIEDPIPRRIAAVIVYFAFLIAEFLVVSGRIRVVERMVEAHLEESNDSFKGNGIEVHMVPYPRCSFARFFGDRMIKEMYIHLEELEFGL